MLSTCFALASALVATSPSAPIIRRHDVPDARYRELARDYPAVCHVGAEGVGVLIDPRWILTASHVAAGVGPFSARVEFGGRGTDLPLRRYAVDRVILHPDYDAEGLQNDIALVRLAEPV
ncbi:MAG: secreted trypsin-like serine protease [Chlamydiales bacterium]|jgi:secreted trypsin-like serine protease